jgi:hypothetical protein
MKKLAAIAGLFVFGSGLMLAETVTGYVTDSACASKGRAGADHKACAQKCAAKGMDVVLVTDDKKVLKIHNQDAVKSMIGDKITAEGKVEGDSIHIDSAKAAM